MTALSPLASILAAFSSALLNAAAASQSETPAQETETSGDATFTSVMEKLLENAQPDAGSWNPETPKSAKESTAKVPSAPDEKADSSKTKAKATSENAVPAWMAAATAPSSTPVPPTTEPKAPKATLPAALEVTPAVVTTAPHASGSPQRIAATPGWGTKKTVEKAAIAEGPVAADRPETEKPGKADTGSPNGTKKAGKAEEPVTAAASPLTDPAATSALIAPVPSAVPMPETLPTASGSANESSKSDPAAPGKNGSKAAATQATPNGAAPGPARQVHPQAEPDSDATSVEPAVRSIDDRAPAMVQAGDAVSAAGASIVAFRARLVPLETAEKPAATAKALPPSSTPATSPSADSPREIQRRDTVPAGSQETTAATQAQPKQEDRNTDRQPSQQQQQQQRQAAAVETQPVVQQTVQSAGASPAASQPSGTSARADANPVPHPVTPAPVTEVKPAAVHDLRLEVSGADQKVEVRLTERAGEVRIAVRTPDTQLAADLRENLPTLSSRLEQTGFRAEALPHDSLSAPGIDRRDLQQASAGGSGDSEQGSRNSGEQQQGNQQQQQHPQRHQTPEEVSELKTKRKEFAWFLSPQA